MTKDLGEPFADRVEAAATPAQKAKLAKLSPDQLHSDQLAGEKITQVLDKAPGNGAAIGGIGDIISLAHHPVRVHAGRKRRRIAQEPAVVSVRDPELADEVNSQARGVG